MKETLPRVGPDFAAIVHPDVDCFDADPDIDDHDEDFDGDDDDWEGMDFSVWLEIVEGARYFAPND